MKKSSLKIWRLFFLFFCSFLFVLVAKSQTVFYNNGADVYINTGAEVSVDGNTENHLGNLTTQGDLYLSGDITNDATISGNGNYLLTGNWINNLTFTAGTSLVNLQGASQIIEGTASTTFYNLSLSGTGIKSLAINTQVSDTLDLTDREMATESYILSVQNTNTNTIQRTTGFVSSLTNGYLVRNTASTSSYLFPVGSSVGTQRYRPVDIIPQSSANSSFQVRMVNNDATTDGYDRSVTDTAFCNTEANFYHLIGRTSGSSDAIFKFYYDEAADGYWDRVGNWQTNVWNSVGNVSLMISSPFNSLTTPILSDFSNEPYIIGINPPTVDLGHDTSFCTGNYVTLDAGAGYDSYSWSTGATTQTIDVSSDTTYSVTVTLSGCQASDTIKVTEHTFSIEIGTETTICPGESAPLYVNGGASYQWSTGDTAANINVSPLTTTTYYVTATDNVCSLVDSVTVHVSSLPNVNAGTDQTICIGDSIILSASGGLDYVWNTGDSTSNVTASPTATTTYTVTATNVNGCTASDDVTIIVISGITVAITGDTSLCKGESSLLTASGATSYSWNTGQTDSSITVSPAVNTSYTVIGNIGTCTDTTTITVNVHPLPSAYAGTDTTVCSGTTVTLTATGGGSYSWSNGSNSASQQVTPTISTTYTVTVTSMFGCEASDDIIITVVQTPTANAGSNQNICYGETVQLNATGGSTYQWNSSSTLSDENIYNPVASPLVTTTYYLTVSNGNCFDTDSITITVNDLPQVDAGLDTTIYIGESIQLNATASSGVVNYEWSPQAYLSEALIANPIASPQTTITYTVTVTDINGCENSDNITITAIEQPVYEVVIYNTFTPNADGINDTWYIENIDKYPDNLVQVYNRNGHKVYEKKGYLNEWDGKYYGNDLPAATYYYIVDLGDGSDILKGNVTIVR